MKAINLYTFLLALFIIQFTNAQENRTLNGTNNNIANPSWGAALTPLLNVCDNGFSDLISEPGGVDRENARVVSNELSSQSKFMPNELGLSDFVWGWGQFVDHDIDLTDDNATEEIQISVPECDPMFDPFCTGTNTIQMFRSFSDPTSGTGTDNPRRHMNDITAYIDASAVYGSDLERANWLRTFNDGKLKISSGNLLPWNTIDGEFDSAADPDAPHMASGGMPSSKWFIGGDIRINEQPGLICFHTLFVREHNRLCDELAKTNPTWDDEQLYQRARKIVGGLIQAVTYEEFLPVMGVPIADYSGYNPSINAGIFNAFSGAAYRFGHTTVNGRLVRYEENGDDWVFGSIDLRDGFFNPTVVSEEGGLDPYFRGMAAQVHQMVDPLIMNDLRNFLFGPPGAGGLDLLSINVERGRERGLPDYNTVRENIGLTAHTSFEDLTSDTELQNKLENVYQTVDDIDPFIGFMSEDHETNGILGEGLNKVLKAQFENLRDGDRYYYENDPAFSVEEINTIKNTKLSEIILRNTEIEILQENVFEAIPRNELSVELLPFGGVMNIDIKAYPNPVQKYFKLRIEARRASNATLRIFDVNGITVTERKINIVPGITEHSFELSDNLANGMYVISLISDSGKGQLKIVKNK